MSFTPTVSVIIPTYNRAKTLDRAIKSVLNQTYPDLELIIVDDCSTDATIEVINNYKDNRLVYIKHIKNRGEGGARNTGINNSRAKCIAFLDSDDEWFLNKLEKQLPLMLRSDPKIGVVYSHYIMQYEDGSHISFQRPNMKGDIFLELLSGKCFLPSSAIIKRECFNKYLHDEKLPSLQDLDLWLQIAQDYQFDYIAEPLCKIYLGTPVQATRNVRARMDGLDLFLNKWGILIVNNLGDKEIRKIRDKIVSSLYTVIRENMETGDRIGSIRMFFQLALRANDFYRGPYERKAIVYNLSLILLGVKLHQIVVKQLKTPTGGIGTGAILI